MATPTTPNGIVANPTASSTAQATVGLLDAGDNPYDRLPAEFDPLLFDELDRLTGGRRDPLLQNAQDTGDFRNRRTRLIKRFTVPVVLPAIPEKPVYTHDNPVTPRSLRFLVRIRQEWVFLGYTLGELTQVQALDPGAAVDEATSTLTSTSTETLEEAHKAILQAARFLEQTSTTTAVERLQNDLRTITTAVGNTAVQPKVSVGGDHTWAAVGGFVGGVLGGPLGAGAGAYIGSHFDTPGIEAGLGGDVGVRPITTTVLNGLDEERNITENVNQVLRQSERQVNEAVAQAVRTLQSVQQRLSRSVSQVSPLLARVSNLLKWTMYENYAVLTHIEGVRLLQPTPVAQMLGAARNAALAKAAAHGDGRGLAFTPDDIVEYRRVFWAPLLEPSLRPHFEFIRRKLAGAENDPALDGRKQEDEPAPVAIVVPPASFPPSRASVLDFTVHHEDVSESLEVDAYVTVALAGASVEVPLSIHGTATRGTLVLPGGLDASVEHNIRLTLTVKGHVPGEEYYYGKARVTGLDATLVFPDGTRRVHTGLLQAAMSHYSSGGDYSSDRSMATGRGRETGSGEETFPFVDQQDVPLTPGSGTVQPPAGVAKPSTGPDLSRNPLVQHVNRNREYYLGLLLEAAMLEPAFRRDCRHLSGLPSHVWELPILGFDGTDALLVRDVDLANPAPAEAAVVDRIRKDVGSGMVLQLAVPGAYGEALEGLLQLTDAVGKLHPGVAQSIPSQPLAPQAAGIPIDLKLEELAPTP